MAMGTSTVLCDYFSKWSEAWAVPDHTALTVGYKVVSEFFCRFGFPKQIHSDQGREFESELFSVLCEKLGIAKTRITPYRPQSDGLVDSFYFKNFLVSSTLETKLLKSVLIDTSKLESRASLTSSLNSF